ncbi:MULTISPECIES: rhodanese-like domain-containing protein [unclassified Streptococcus]|uniref:rhodanese-like domain-containing protein n=1 Tax=unclassified Streptococcus TaxID=2608887 RepID=UPI001071CD71|nr:MULTISPECIES: rhodanese-like domain-containing protein [unclassified Streptococcus]MBF0787665.1 rhodanese-like domain-containing protein [Streptococcus sp. 19428wC2_LYSM12]MCQ9212237.1 rhodanese-like domain-containing protein [Streptococcus sp. B01]MCQ9213568.1 rhodanese-like domain-containing protein [Streptococcus sp. O1]TFV05386.1 rhodanese-like domain-containing protein [Streptococcus sp. LYSM12]
MKKKSIILLGFASVLGLLAHQEVGTATKQEVKRTPGQQLVNRANRDIKWLEASKDSQTYQIRFEQVVAAVKNGAKCYDVRSFIEYQLGHVEVAEHYPLATLGRQEFPALVHEVPIYLYSSDSRSSAQAATLLRDEGFQYVYDLGSLDQVKAIGAVLNEWW